MERQLVTFVDRVKSGGGISDEVSSEYNSIRAQTADRKQRSSFTTDAGGLKENIKKNRYKDILPYDQTRVRLEPLENKFESDYINASFIQGATRNKRYIATQGPLSHTLGDFWRMLWQYNVKVIVMACREIEMGKRKCERYWAAHSETSTFGPFVVTNLEEVCPNEEVVVRILQVKYQDESRTLSQFQYTAWPDHDIPYTSDGILGMMDMLRKVQGTDAAPILVHCSAGCGRTGVICTVDYVHDLLLTQRITEDFSIMEIVTVMRTQRPSAVQTKEQYGFVYHTVAQMFQKHLLALCNNNKSLAENLRPLYDNVESVSRQQPQTQPHRASSVQPRSRPSLVPQRPHSGQPKMNDTYAVVNKSKQRPVAASTPSLPTRSPPPAVHHYDNAGLGAPLYSKVKPKSHRGSGGSGGGPPTQSVSPTYDRALPQYPRGAEASPAADHGDYEPLPGIFSSSSRKVSDTPKIRKQSEDLNSTDDDYEYVSNPIKGTAGYSSPGGMGFNCRIKKPKGPRDPPAEWSRAER
ncbi:tyrosine-protein phosphatase non-receptor type 18 isoform X2 [Anguilla anguilla]|uniref:tyrosine-protein phosphatase non-receptor type 18 isoform X2 n=1 Tax=Anguilla anguilla TaxID=7936 RepID=UPI0015AE0555|nr:tyrosine-protein phosphatase non-receptor type 18 isoform X2 [Anguilla anguilla]